MSSDEQKLSIWEVLIFALLLFSPIVFALIYVLYWLKFGAWPDWSLIGVFPNLLSHLPVGWIGLLNIILWVFSLPIIYPFAAVSWGGLWLFIVAREET